ncbi:hypothetical protein KUCAC02_012321 [Chaenocephalus aceratus]|uniref:Uncharacterized protein n=1 Tax=Chaenocephalus aceratus TaxID=36190 RepID=A0ACB9XC10_CHAAC|nr:hypothetical protein KUCAC02_012321 [Chaenocephalus aceratus]
MGKPAAERQREYRARRNADPDRRENYLRSERKRWKMNTEEGKKKTISDLSDRAERQKRTMWRKAQRRHEEREAFSNINTPPQRPNIQHAVQPDLSPQGSVWRAKSIP